MMHMPFTTEQFVSVFTRYNHAIGPAPLVAYTLAAVAIYLIATRSRFADRFVPAALAAMWAFTGVGYHLLSFSAINPAARLFGAMFVLQAAFFAVEAFRGRLHFELAIRPFRARMGHVMLAYSMVVYPIVGMLAGHGYPNGPSFGVTPCPLVIFTFGLLMLTDRKMPKYLVAIPLAWALVGASAALSLGIREDTGLLVSGLIASTALLLRRTRERAAAVSGDAAALGTAHTHKATGLHALVHRAVR